MKHAFSCCNRSLSTNLDIDWKINFSSNCRTFYIDNPNCFYAFNFLEIIDFIYQIFSLSWLTDHNYTIIFYHIVLEHFRRIKYGNFFETIQKFEEIKCRLCSIIRWPTSYESSEISKMHCLHSLEFRSKFNLTLLPYLITIECFEWLRRLNQNILLLFNWYFNQSITSLKFFFEFWNHLWVEFPYLSTLGYKIVLNFLFEGNWLWCHINLLIIETDKDRGTMGRCPYFIGFIFIHDNYAPLWIFGCFCHDLLAFFYWLDHR